MFLTFLSRAETRIKRSFAGEKIIKEKYGFLSGKTEAFDNKKSLKQHSWFFTGGVARFFHVNSAWVNYLKILVSNPAQFKQQTEKTRLSSQREEMCISSRRLI